MLIARVYVIVAGVQVAGVIVAGVQVAGVIVAGVQVAGVTLFVTSKVTLFVTL